MTTENSAETGNQNPGEGEQNTNEAAKQQEGQATAPGTSEGQGNEGGKQEPAKGDKPADGEKEGGDKPAGAPEQYGQFKLPDGFSLEGDRLNTATEFFKAKGWTQEQAQEAVDLYTRVAGEDAAAIQAALTAQRQQQIEDWGAQAKTQLGEKYDEHVDLARTAVRAVNDPALIAAFEDLGWGSHPALIKAFAFFGGIARDSGMDGLGGSTAPSRSTDLATRLFGDGK
ncbi:hypothetical protein [Pseudoxanthomonas sp. JBR18]|uniref:hypothetical protein n=1 Tax=Pseudoxanthomonas sp. JBR18 TaxID=2969308 RepID=UPI002305C2C5|nr:hypothetical protein [Pseudoxanthomonas sp. JBR18]WCE04431.1 hypothetical protein PJ250_00005 [Pseudoxanthomonas sp. JBR18]